MVKASNSVKDIKKRVLDATLQSLENASDDIQSTARDATQQWKRKPAFGEIQTITKERIELLIKPKGDNKKIFQYVDMGTKGPYPIPKVLFPGRKPLKFRSGYSARTLPLGKYNQGSGQSFGQWVTKHQVMHPGIKPRKFLETFMNELIPSLQFRTQSEINKVA